VCLETFFGTPDTRYSGGNTLLYYTRHEPVVTQRLTEARLSTVFSTPPLTNVFSTRRHTASH
jgi:hypothetical protein